MATAKKVVKSKKSEPTKKKSGSVSETTGSSAKKSKGGKEKGKSKGDKKKSRFDVDALIAALPTDVADATPDLPIAVAIHEALTVYDAAQKIEKKLRGLPFDGALLSTLPKRVEALRKAQGEWEVHRRKSSAVPEKIRREAEELRREAFAAGRYLLRNDADVQARLDAIAEGEGLADAIEDLRQLSALVKEHASALKKAKLAGGAEKAAARMLSLSKEMQKHLSDARTDDEGALAQQRRNGCYALVKLAVSEVRAAARYVLRDDPKALAPFRAEYTRAKQRSKRSKSAKDTDKKDGEEKQPES